jgi:hypothetical protein
VGGEGGGGRGSSASSLLTRFGLLQNPSLLLIPSMTRRGLPTPFAISAARHTFDDIVSAVYSTVQSTVQSMVYVQSSINVQCK